MFKENVLNRDPKAIMCSYIYHSKYIQTDRQKDRKSWRSQLTWMTARGDWEKYQSGTPNKLSKAALVSNVSEQRVLMMLPPAGHTTQHANTLKMTDRQTHRR